MWGMEGAALHITQIFAYKYEYQSIFEEGCKPVPATCCNNKNARLSGHF
jgi:hypothetical protein